MSERKQVLVLGRGDHTEAMRVSAGLTIFGHHVRLVLMDRPVADTKENALQVETLELCDITPETTIDGQGLPLLDDSQLALALIASDCVISL